ncbi:phage major capsid protein [Phosphitispora fastidiosa]|uniref:phage major capsid protein n=1 Tax=Phosphitispora fastidiosa TaxID=2837202 RepID=UPI001E2C8624|nr:phage major capsid protein [Phosphitispora fastidiosa]MBU7006307.1 hypothetical protein [Phosphitispora fastidiosa]
MAELTMSAIAEALKLWYLEGLRYQMNEKASAFLTQIERTSEHVEGKKIIMALRYGVQGGIGNRADNGTLPTSNSRKTKQAEWETKNLFARIQLSDKTIKASRSSVGAFARMLETEISDCEIDCKRDLSRQAVGDGTGVLCTITSINAGTKTITCNNDIGVQYLAVGMLVDVYDVDAETIDNAGVEVTAVDRANKTAVLSALDASIGNGDVLYVNGNKDLEITGLKGVFENTTLYDVIRSTETWFNATKIATVGEISEIKMQQGIDDADIEAGSEINFMLGSHGVRRGYLNLLNAQKQLVNTMELKGGFKAISFNGLPFVADKFIAPGELYFLDLSDWKVYEMSDYEWLNEDGAVLNRVANKPVWEATMAKYCDLGCQKPKGQVKMSGITEH